MAKFFESFGGGPGPMCAPVGCATALIGGGKKNLAETIEILYIRFLRENLYFSTRLEEN